MGQFKFSVDSSSNDEACAEAINRLEQVVKLGQEAQRALDAIRDYGYYEGPAPVATEPCAVHDFGFDRGPGTFAKGYVGHSIRPAVLQKRSTFSRVDLPPLDNLKLEYGPMKKGQYGGHDCSEVPLFAYGLVARQTDPIGKLEFDEDKHQLGVVRINKHHLSFVEDDYSRRTVQVYKTFSSSPAKADAAALTFATRLARVMVGVSRNDDHEEYAMAAKTLDLQRAVPRWFIEDGVIERMFGEIHQYITCVTVMES